MSTSIVPILAYQLSLINALNISVTETKCYKIPSEVLQNCVRIDPIKRHASYFLKMYTYRHFSKQCSIQKNCVLWWKLESME